MRKSNMFAIVLSLAVIGLPLLAQEFTEEFRTDCHFTDRVAAGENGNPYFSLEPGWWLALQGVEEEDGEVKNIYLEITVLNETRMVDGVLTRVIEEREWINDELYEVSLNYYAICQETGDVFYFGEEVDFYEDGVVINHEGAWLAGVDGALPGIIMPGSPQIGARYMQEIAVEDDALDRGEVLDITDLEVNGIIYENVVVIADSTALEPDAEPETKYFAPGVGKIRDQALLLVDSGYSFRVPNRWISHVTSLTGGFETELRFVNEGEAATMTLTPYLLDGQAGEAVSVEVAAGAVQVVDTRELFAGVDVSHLAVDGPTDCKVFAVYEAASGTSTAAEVRESSRALYSMTLFEGAWGEDFWDGLALVNLGNLSADITATRKNADGTVLDETDLYEGLASHAKARIVLGDHLQNQPGSLVEITSDQPFAATLLRGTSSSQFTVMWPPAPAATAYQPEAPESSAGLEVARLLIEHNATDNDTGFQGFADGEPWNQLVISGPAGTVVMCEAEGALDGFGLTELFFETSEPEADEMPLADVLARLPEGTYTFTATMVDGSESTKTTTFTHTIPAGPQLLTPADEEENVDPSAVVISWNPVNQTIDGSALNIVGYQVIVELDEDSAFPDTFSHPEFNTFMPANATSVSVPASFFELNKRYKYEVLAIEESGNQSISERVFYTGAKIEDEEGEDEEPEISEARFFIEHNGTDEDTGFQGFGDGDPWNDMSFAGPDDDFVSVDAMGSLVGFGLTELFFETSEPPNAEVPISDVLALMAEGTYVVEGALLSGEEDDAETTFSHTIPAPPELVGLDDAEDVDPNNAVISWNPVTTDLNGSSDITIVGYQVIVERDVDQAYPMTFAKKQLSIHLPASATSLQIPAEFLEADAEYGFEILAIEASGNQTISESGFETAE